MDQVLAKSQDLIHFGLPSIFMWGGVGMSIQLRRASLAQMLSFYGPLIVAIFGFGLIQLCRVDSTQPFKVNLNLVAPPPGIERFSFGYRETVADILWLRLLQDSSICENAKDGVARPADVSMEAEPLCKMGWVYRMVDSITSLALRWGLPYRIGGVLLSVMVNDRLGASLILEKGMKAFPYDYSLHYTAAYHYIYEDKKPQRAAEVLMVAAQNGGPGWFYSLAGKLYSEAGQAELGIIAIEDALKVNKDPKVEERLKWRLKELKAILEKKP